MILDVDKNVDYYNNLKLGYQYFLDFHREFLDNAILTNDLNYVKLSAVWGENEGIVLRNTISRNISLYKNRVVLCLNWRGGSNVATFYSSKPFNIFLNGNRLNRTAYSIAGSILHEMIHLIDRQDRENRYGHARKTFWRSWSKIRYSTPYYLGEKFKDFLKNNA